MSKEYTIQHEIEAIEIKINEIHDDLKSLEILVQKSKIYPQLLDENKRMVDIND